MPPTEISPTRLESKHQMVLPAPQFWGSPSSQNFQIHFTGEAIINNFKGNVDGTWHIGNLELSVFDMGMDIVMRHVLPPVQTGVIYEFVPVQSTVYASVNAQSDPDNLVNTGFGAYNFGITTLPGNNFDRFLKGMFVGLQVKNKDAIIYRIGYSMNLYGYFTLKFKL